MVEPKGGRPGKTWDWRWGRPPRPGGRRTARWGASRDGLPSGEVCRDSASFGLVEAANLQELVDAASDAFVAFDSVGQIRSWNTAASRIFGYGPDEALGQLTMMLVPDIQESAQQARVERVLDGEHIYSVNADGRRRDGAVVPLRLAFVPTGEGRGDCVIARDLTEEHLAQTTLTEAEFRLGEAQELSHVGLWLWDEATDLLQISDELYRIYGISPRSFEGTMTALLDYSHPEDRTALTSAMQESLRTGVDYEQEYRIERLDGSLGWIYSRARRPTCSCCGSIPMYGSNSSWRPRRQSELGAPSKS